MPSNCVGSHSRALGFTYTEPPIVGSIFGIAFPAVAGMGFSKRLVPRALWLYRLYLKLIPQVGQQRKSATCLRACERIEIALDDCSAPFETRRADAPQDEEFSQCYQ